MLIPRMPLAFPVNHLPNWGHLWYSQNELLLRLYVETVALLIATEKMRVSGLVWSDEGDSAQVN